MAIGDMITYCISESDKRVVEARSALHRATPRGYQGVLGHYPEEGENLPAITVKDVDATHKNLRVILPGGDEDLWVENAPQGAADTPGT